MVENFQSRSVVSWVRQGSIGSIFRCVQFLAIPIDLPLVFVCITLFGFAIIPTQYLFVESAIRWLGWHGSESGLPGHVSSQSVQITTLVSSLTFLGRANINYIADALAVTTLLLYMSHIRSTALLPARDTAALVFGFICTMALLLPTISIANAWLQPFGNYSVRIAEWQIGGLGDWAQAIGDYIDGLERTQFLRTVLILIFFAFLGFIPLSIMGSTLFITSIANRRRLGGLGKRSEFAFMSGILLDLLEFRSNAVRIVLLVVAGPLLITLSSVVFLTVIESTSGLRDVVVREYLPEEFLNRYALHLHLYICASFSIFLGMLFGVFSARYFGVNSLSVGVSFLICSMLFLFGAVSDLLIWLAVDDIRLKTALGIFILLVFASAPPFIWALSFFVTFGTAVRAFIKSRQKRLASLNTPWLFLRAFSLDEKMVAWPLDAFRAVPVLGRRKLRLEHVLAEAVFRFGPLIAVGNPADPSGDHGIPREFLSDQEWQPFVENSIQKHRGTIFLMGDGGFVAWETGKIVEFGAQKRTIFVAPPHIDESQKYLSSISDLSARSEIPSTVLDRVGSGDCIAFYWAANGWVAILNRRRSAHDYRMAMHKALYDMSRSS